MKPDAMLVEAETEGRAPDRRPASGELVLCLLDDELRFRGDTACLAGLLGRIPAVGSHPTDLALGIYRGALPKRAAVSAPLDRLEARVRVGRLRRTALSFTRLPDGWLLECRDVTVEEAVTRICAYLDVAPAGGEAEALLAGLREAFALRHAELSRIEDDAVRPIAASPGGTAGTPAGPAERLTVGLSDGRGRAWRLSVLVAADGRAPAEIDGWLAELAPHLGRTLSQVGVALERDAARDWMTGVLDAASEAVVSLDASGRTVGFSVAAERMFGIDRERAVGLPVEDLLADDQSLDRRAALAILIDSAAYPPGPDDSGGRSTVEVLAKGADGACFEVSVRAAGRGAVRTLLFEDISGRRTAEAALERNRSQIVAILDSLRDAVFAVDRGLQVVYANDAAGRLLGRDPTRIVGASVWDSADILWDQLGPELFRCIGQREKQELELRWPSGDRWFDARILPTEIGASIFLLDVTDRRRASDLERESAARYRAVSELTTDLVVCYRVDPSGGLTREWNIGRAVDVLGRELPQNISAPEFLSLVHPYDRTAGAAFMNGLLSGRDVSTELRIISPGGGVRWVEAHGKPQPDAPGEAAARVLCAIRDISTRKRTETALRESEERFALAVEGAAEGLWDWDLRRSTIFRSEHLRGMLGVPPDEDLQRWDWWAEQVHPDDFERYRDALKRHRASRESLFAAEYRVRHRDGTWRWILDRAVSRRGSDGRVERIVGAVTDISDRKTIELQLKAANAVIEEKNQQIQVALDNISQGLALFDSDDRLMLFNRRYRELYRMDGTMRVGVTRRALMEASIAAGNFTPEEAATVIRRTLQGGASGLRHVVHRLTDGTVIEVTTTQLPGGGTVATYTDVTPREHREQEMRAARDAAEAANRAKSAFLANMSHELRTPLNAVIGFSDVMKAEMFGPLGSENYISYASDIHASGQLLLDLINDILDISKIEAGKAEVAEEVFDLHEVVEASILLCREQAAASSLVLRARVATDLPRLRGDSRYVRQILLNLVSNAVKFTPGGGRVTVCVWREPQGGIVLAVADTGIGIPEKMQTRVFEPFFQVQSDLAREYQGTGLGLSLVKGLTELHGGRVEVTARRRRGTIFRVRLPAYRNVGR